MKLPFERVLFVAFHGHRHWTRGLSDYLRECGVKTRVLVGGKPFATRWFLKRKALKFTIAKHVLAWEIERADHVFMWNGDFHAYLPLREVCKKTNTPCTIMEVGYFPQKDFLTLDSQGINANSSLMQDSLDWVTSRHIDNIDEVRANHLQGRQWIGDGDYIAIPLQLAHDTNIVRHSDFNTMQEFIDHCEVKFPDHKLIFKRHPYDKQEYTSRHEIVTDGNFLDLAMHAELIYGINSTCLLETLLMNAPTQAIGNGFISAHKHQSNKLLAALIDKQIPISTTNMQYWVEKYCAKTP